MRHQFHIWRVFADIPQSVLPLDNYRAKIRIECFFQVFSEKCSTALSKRLRTAAKQGIYKNMGACYNSNFFTSVQSYVQTHLQLVSEFSENVFFVDVVENEEFRNFLLSKSFTFQI